MAGRPTIEGGTPKGVPPFAFGGVGIEALVTLLALDEAA
jgi:hypothetical protein